MPRDHFQDIIPPSEPHRQGAGESSSRADETHTNLHGGSNGENKSIRNINITRRGAPAEAGRMIPQRTSTRVWLWIMAGVCILVVAFLGMLYAFRRTSVTVVPHAQPVVFDKTMQFTAYPVETAASGTLAYSVKSADFDDAQEVEASGVIHKEQKATGTLTVYNNYAATPVKLLKNTRFETSSGLIFRTPAAVSVPGREGSTPGKIDITVVADAAGAPYNIATGEKLTLPGLKSNAAMHTAVYAIVSAATTGGYLGDAPNVPDSALAAAQSAIRSRLQEKATAFRSAEAGGSGQSVPLDLIITYSEQSPVQEQGVVKVRERAHVDLPVVDMAALSGVVAQLVAASASTLSYSIVPGDNFAVDAVDSSARLGTDPITFTITGSARLVAMVDTEALATALAGRDSVAFQSIVSNFPGVDTAHARIQPFWESAFPIQPEDIRIIVQPPPSLK